MRRTPLIPILLALVALGLACRPPAVAPKSGPVSKTDDAETRRRAEEEARRRAEEVARRKREQEEAEKARLAAGDVQAKAYRNAAEAALQDLHFDYDKSEIKAEDKGPLQKIADFLRSYPQANLVVEGHCDERGTVEYNIALGDRRANSALQYLTALGVGKDRLSTVSYGKERPLCTEANESCWSRNRRAHFILRQ